jgi:hypothetical protein
MEKFTNQESNLEFKSHLEEKLFEFITNSEYKLSGQSAVNIILATEGL